jgi:hypothetical protein
VAPPASRRRRFVVLDFLHKRRNSSALV